MTTRGTFEGDTANTETEQISDTFRGTLNDTPEIQTQSLRDSVAIALNTYFANLDGQQPTDVYQMILSEIEAPLLEAVMRHTRNNQCKAATLLGLNRGTLRKKLKRYGLL